MSDEKPNPQPSTPTPPAPDGKSTPAASAATPGAPPATPENAAAVGKPSSLTDGDSRAKPPASAAGDPAPASADPDWRASLPQELRDALGDADPAEAAKVYARGKDYKPAQTTDEIKITLDTDSPHHPGLEKLFKEMCVAQKLTPAQAQALVEFNGTLGAEAQRLYLEHGNTRLEERFGADTDKVKDKALKMFTGLDRAMDGRLSKSAAGRQIASDPMIVEALYLIYQKVGEDSLGGGSPNGGAEKEMSDKEFFEHVFKEQQKSAAPAQ
jgi:hypothetical protein